MPHLHGQREKEDQGGGRGKITGKLLRLTVKFSWGGCMAASAGREGKHDGGAWRLFGTVAFGLLSASRRSLDFTCSNCEGHSFIALLWLPQRGWEVSGEI